MQNRLLDRFEIKRERGRKQKCQICLKPFSLLVREHQCKRCIRAVCDDCKSKKKVIFLENMQKAQKGLCKVCSIQSDSLQNHVNGNHLKFGQSSQIGNKWFNKIISKSIQQQVNEQVKYKIIPLTKSIFKELWDSYNYSLRQFIGLLTYHINQDVVYARIKNVYDKVVRKYPSEKIQNLIYLIIFILCYCNQTQSIKICTYFIQIKTNVKQNYAQQLVNSYLKILGLREDQIKRIFQYLSRKIQHFFSNFSINIVTAEASTYLINSIVQKDMIQQLYSFLSILIFINKQDIQKNKINGQIELLLVRNCNLDQIGRKYKILSGLKFDQVQLNQKVKKTQKTKKNQFIRATQNLDIKTDLIQNINTVEPKNKSLLFQPKKGYQRQNIIDQQNNNGYVVFSKMNSINKLQEVSQLQTKSRKATNNIFENLKNYNIIEKQCEKCCNYQKQLEEIKKQLQFTKLQILDLESKIRVSDSTKTDEILNQQQNQQLQTIKAKDQLLRLRKISTYKYQAYEKQIKKLKQETNYYKLEYQKSNESLNKIRLQIVNAKNQVEEAHLTNKMLRNILDSATMNPDDVRVTQKNQLVKINQSLKNLLMDKNSQIQNIMKKNKLLTYQMQQLNNFMDKYNILEEKIKYYQNLNLQYLNKINQLSKLLVNEQAQKLQLSSTVFGLRQDMLNNSQKKQQSEPLECITW